jgi:hypothetical protein
MTLVSLPILYLLTARSTPNLHFLPVMIYSTYHDGQPSFYEALMTTALDRA